MIAHSAFRLISGLTFLLSLSLQPLSASAQEENAYIGSNGCGMCHSAVKKDWAGHGHSMMLRPVENGAAPHMVKVGLPEGKGWDGVSYVIGGARTYARFTDAKGYVVTGPKAQWSMKGNALTAFKADSAPGTYKYDCIRCHTVGWRESGAYDDGVENALEGIPGAWHENGVGCEACHGMGERHAALKNKSEVKKTGGDMGIVRDGSFEACGTCHKRTADNTLLLAGKDLIQSRQQYTELKLSWKGRTRMTCTSCHNPHVTAASEEGITQSCKECHSKREIKIQAMAGLACIDCHMPLADRGAFDETVQNYHRGDMRSHLFGITADPAYVLDGGDGKAAVNGKGVVRLTVEMTCGACHLSGTASGKDRNALLESAKTVHNGS